MNNLAMATGGRVITNIDDVMAASKPEQSRVPKPRAEGMLTGADMDRYEVGNSFYSPFDFSCEPNFARKNPPMKVS